MNLLTFDDYLDLVAVHSSLPPLLYGDIDAFDIDVAAAQTTIEAVA
jgi:hypothetical protein